MKTRGEKIGQHSHSAASGGSTERFSAASFGPKTEMHPEKMQSPKSNSQRTLESAFPNSIIPDRPKPMNESSLRTQMVQLLKNEELYPDHGAKHVSEENREETEEQRSRQSRMTNAWSVLDDYSGGRH